MMQIKMNKEKWRILIREEEFEFEDKKEFDETLKIMINLKEKCGKLER